MRILGILLILVGILVFIVLPVRAQEPVYLKAVEPSEGHPGQELELTLWGSGFGSAQKERLAMGDIEVMDAWIESDDAIMIHVFIPEDAPPDPQLCPLILQESK